nr:MAG: MC035R-like protein [Molluscum contagiosum virus]
MVVQAMCIGVVQGSRPARPCQRLRLEALHDVVQSHLPQALQKARRGPCHHALVIVIGFVIRGQIESVQSIRILR